MGTGISIADSYSNETVAKRKLLWNSAQDERKRAQRVRLDYDKAFVDADMYSWDDEKNRRVKVRLIKSTPSAVSQDCTKQRGHHEFRLVNFNARSIVNKTAGLEYILVNYDPHVVTITETWLRLEIQDNEIIPPGYKIVRRDRWQSRGGGVAIIMKENIEFITLGDIPGHESL